MSLRTSITVERGPLVKSPSVSGSFYPADPASLRAEVEQHLKHARSGQSAIAQGRIKALIVPHAGYRYSGPVAASAYAALAAQLAANPASEIRRVVLLGPAHRAAVEGFAASSVDCFNTPLGDVPLDKEGVALALQIPGVAFANAAFAGEHSLEVQLPFLQVVLGAFSLVPLLCGNVDTAGAAALVNALWGGPETLVVVSSDLSHFLDYGAAQRRDRATTLAIESLRPDAIGYEDACGRNPMRGLLRTARERRLDVCTADLRNSGDTAGGKDRVVGYGAYVLCEARPAVSESLTPGQQSTLVGVARASIEHGLIRREPLTPGVADYVPRLRARQSCFVTLRLAGALRGCIGSVQARHPLVLDVAQNAFGAAFKDPRFDALDNDTAARLDLSIAVLNPPEPLEFASEAELVASLRPGVDGLIIEDSGRRATYLPSVWEGISDPQRFLAELKRKAGLAPEHWSRTLRAARYTVDAFGESSRVPSADPGSE